MNSLLWGGVVALWACLGDPVVPYAGVTAAVKQEWQQASTRSITLTVSTSGCSAAEAAKLAYSVMLPGVDVRVFNKSFRADPSGTTVVQVLVPAWARQLLIAPSGSPLDALPSNQRRTARAEASYIWSKYAWPLKPVVPIPDGVTAAQATIAALPVREASGRVVASGQPSTLQPLVWPLSCYGAPSRADDQGRFDSVQLPTTRALMYFDGTNDVIHVKAVPAGTAAVNVGDLEQTGAATTVTLDITVQPVPSLAVADGFTGCEISLVRSDGLAMYSFGAELVPATAPATGSVHKLKHILPGKTPAVPPGVYYVVPGGDVVHNYVIGKILDGIDPTTIGVQKLTVPSSSPFAATIEVKEALRNLLSQIGGQ